MDRFSSLYLSSNIFPISLISTNPSISIHQHPHYICYQNTNDYFNIWLNLELLTPYIIHCWIDNVLLIYDNNTRTTRNSVGVETRVPGWGDPEVVEWIDPSHAKSGAYFSDIANALAAHGYVRNVSIRGAPYDFRKAPSKSFLCNML